MLVIIRDRHQTAEETYREAHERFDAHFRERAQGSSDKVTPEEAALFQDVESTGTHLDLEIESFYLFAKILLDRIADTFDFYFSTGHKGSTHTTLRRGLPSLQAEKGLCLPPDSPTLELLDELDRVVVDWRNRHIQHASDRKRIPVRLRDSGTIRSGFTMMYPEIPQARRYLELRSETPDEILPKIARYMIAMIDLFEANQRSSVLENPSPEG